jgi:hypothetical protein
MDRSRETCLTNLAPTPGSRETRRLEALDARADEGRRVTTIERDRVVIARGVGGVFMKIALTPAAYRGVALRLMSLDDQGFRYEIHLVHADAELDVELSACRDQVEAEAAWSLWARYFRLPMLVERVEGVYEPAAPMIGEVVAAPVADRRRGAELRGRRPRFLARRKMGRVEAAASIEIEDDTREDAG